MFSPFATNTAPYRKVTRTFQAPSKHHPQREASPPPPRRHLTAPRRWPRPSPTKWRLWALCPALPAQQSVTAPSPVSEASRFKEKLAATGSARQGRQAGRFVQPGGERKKWVVVPGITGSKQTRRGHHQALSRHRKRALTLSPLPPASYRPAQRVQAEGDKACNAKTGKAQPAATGSNNKMELTAAASGLYSKTLVTRRTRPAAGRGGRRLHPGLEGDFGGRLVRRRRVLSPKTEGGGAGHGCRVGHVGDRLGLRKQCEYWGNESRRAY